MRRLALVTFATLSPTLFGCSGSESTSSGSGGSSSIGGNLSAGGGSNTGGSSASAITGGAIGIGGTTAELPTGGRTSPGTSSTGGSATGGSSASTSIGGSATGGSSASTSIGGSATGGKANGTGGASVSLGGATTGGKSTGGSTNTGISTGGAATGGKSSTGGAAPGGSTGGLPRLTVNGNKLQDPSGKTIILRGSSLIDIGSIYAYSGRNTAAITTRMDKVATAGVQGHVVRLPVYPKIDYNTGGTPACSPYPYPVGTGPSATCTPNSPLSAADYYTSILKPAVDYATSKNLYVIIDYHQIDNMTGTGSTTNTSTADALTFWNDIAPKFASYTNVFYEIFNEPIDRQKTWADIKPAVQSIVSAVRAAAPQTVVIVPSNSWDQKPGDAASDPPTGGNLMYTAHMYPSNWTSTGAFQAQVTTACSKAPVFITEWGFANSDANYTTFASTLQTSVDNEGASWTAWVTDNAWTPSMFSDTNMTQLTTFGTQVKTWLAAKATSDWVF